MGIGGAGMSAIARVLHARGVRVTGDDRADSPMLAALNAEGILAQAGHDPAHLAGVDVLAPSSAIAHDEPELVEARRLGLPVWHRGDLLAALLAEHTAIAVAGTHGKSTTTAMIAHILFEAGLEPSWIVGAHVPALGSNARHGSGQAFVIEADEYDRTFLRYQPALAVVTNVEFDHPDTYRDYSETLAAFSQFLASVPADGLIALCEDDAGAVAASAAAMPAATVVGYGLQRGAWRATNLRANPLGGTDFNVNGPGVNGALSVHCSLRLSGEHNVRNALAALIVADACGVPISDAAETLTTFRGADRRFEFKGESRGIRVFDDYAHHPTEIRATLAGARMRFPVGRLWAIWQPHTFSRTAALLEDFAAAFTDADQVIVLPIFAARERIEDFGFAANALNPIEIGRRIKNKNSRSAASMGDAVGMLISQLRGGDVVITLSAGDGNQVGERVLQLLR